MSVCCPLCEARFVCFRNRQTNGGRNLDRPASDKPDASAPALHQPPPSSLMHREIPSDRGISHLEPFLISSRAMCTQQILRIVKLHALTSAKVLDQPRVLNTPLLHSTFPTVWLNSNNVTPPLARAPQPKGRICMFADGREEPRSLA